MRQWLATPPGLPVVDSELVVRALSGDLMLTEEWFESLLALRPAIEYRRAKLTLAKRNPRSPRDEPGRSLGFALHDDLLNAYTAWLKRVESELRSVRRAGKPRGRRA